MRKFAALILFNCILCFNAYSQADKQYYVTAYKEQLQMLTGQKPVSFKRSVFLTENAFYSNKLSYQAFCQDVSNISVQLKAMIKAKGIGKYKTAPNWATFYFMTDTIPANNFRPFTYDFEDFTGSKDWSKMFVTKLLKTHSGNCHSLPYLYKILCEEIGGTAYLAFAPNHCYIKHMGENGQWTNKMVDLNGMDGEVSGSGTKKDPYVIKANYYYVNGSLSDKQVTALNDGVASYNKMGGKDGVEIKNADGTKSYVKYSLSASGVKDAQAAKDAAYGDKFTDKGGTERFFGNIVGEGASGSGGDYGSATNRNVNFNNANIKDGIDNKGMNESRLLEGIVIHEIGHNLGGEHSDGTSTMSQITTNNIVRDIGPSSSYISYPGTSKDFTKIIFDRRDTRMQDPNARVLQPGLYTKQ
ncbi:hypothetical protein SAMN05216464_1358 [Mucilaginibacter pineti]|uniref:Metallo-peptidase family M12B Reprolysin-like n=1 Tax=Mucilaginibacter pineti TaxID=1391627 RepID=A0A1G7P5I9_9SPHI|nr:hypothetical protein [Mucilaginibacter pineti]SDF81606.1 hypothetical protein SAMN05216464_1358 [Mucilaginibacter pineti]